MSGIAQMLFGGGGGGAPVTPYETVISGLTHALRWKLEETSGTSAADASGNGRNGTLFGGATFATATASAPVGGAGFGKGANMNAASFNSINLSSAAPPTVGFGGSSSSSWTIGLVCSGGGGASRYIASRQNNAAIIQGFVTDKVEFFAQSYTGSDPRPGSQMTLNDSGDSSTAHFIVYRYDNGQWAGFLDGVEQFNVARSFGTATSYTSIHLGSDGSGNFSNCTVWDFWIVNSAVPSATIAAAWAGRNSV